MRFQQLESWHFVIAMIKAEPINEMNHATCLNFFLNGITKKGFSLSLLKHLSPRRLCDWFPRVWALHWL